MSLYTILNKDAMNWWHNIQLRKDGNIQEARQRERETIRRNVRNLRTAIENGGWVEVYDDRFLFQIRAGEQMSGLGKMDEPIVVAALLVGITVIDHGPIMEKNLFQLPMPNPWRADRGKSWGPMSLCPLWHYISEVEKMGATVHNKDSALSVERERRIA